MILPILKGPDPRLLQVSRAVDLATDGPALDDLRETFMDSDRARGLAAVQVGHLIRAFIMRGDHKGVVMFINPSIISSSHQTKAETEECMSFPWLKVPVVRPVAGNVEWTDEFGSRHTGLLQGWDFRCFLHEMDHLNGITLDLIRRRK